jgi:glycosyltransferase involved in cell wall biosynthesis
VLVDVQDLWPDSLSATGMVSSPAAIALAGAMCRFVYRRAERLIVLSPGFKQALVGRGVPADKVDVVLNWADENYTRPRGILDLGPYELAGRFNIVYAGNLGAAQGLDVVLGAAKRAAKVEPRVQFLLAGSGIDGDRLAARIEGEGLTNVRMAGRIPRDQIADLLTAADALLLTLADHPLFEMTIPSKTQFYLAIGRPILNTVGGEVARIIAESGAGVTAPTGDAAALADAACALARSDRSALDEMGRRGRAYYAERMSMASGIAATLTSLERTVSRSPPRLAAAGS